MAYKQYRLSRLFEFLEFVIAFCLEKDIAYRQCLIYYQNLGININCHRKSQSHEHTTGISFAGLIYVIPYIRKSKYGIKSFIYLFLGESHHGSVEIDILDSVIFHIESGTQFKES